MITKYCILFLLLSALFSFESCKQVHNYIEHNSPSIHSYNRMVANHLADTLLTVASYNIKYAIEIEEALIVIESIPKENIDIILLQEMDELSTQQMAKHLKCNYVYFPISYMHRKDKNFGNAILTPWPIISTEKIILPHKKPFTGTKRASTKAVIKYGDKEIDVYSLHLETVILKRRKRLAQLNHIIESQQLKETNRLTILGGDFNSFFPKDLKEMRVLLKQANFDFSTEGIGHTSDLAFKTIKPKLDHIVTKGFKTIVAGKIPNQKASDHFLVWAEIKL